MDRALHFWLWRNPCSENWYFNQIDAPGKPAETPPSHMVDDSNPTLQEADIDLGRCGLVERLEWLKPWRSQAESTAGCCGTERRLLNRPARCGHNLV